MATVEIPNVDGDLLYLQVQSLRTIDRLELSEDQVDSLEGVLNMLEWWLDAWSDEANKEPINKVF